MRPQKFNVVFRLNLQKPREEKFPIYMRVFVDGQKIELSTKLYVNESSWDKNKCKVRPGVPIAHLYNTSLDKISFDLHQIFMELSAAGQRVFALNIKNRYLGIDDKPKEKTIVDAFDYHNLKMGELVKIGKISKATLNRYVITKNKVVAFMEDQYKCSDKDLVQIRLRFVTEFEHFLLTIQKIQSNTAHKYIKNLKKIMNMSVGLDWISHNPFNQFKCSYTAPEREILFQEEIDTIWNKEIEIDRLSEVRDAFIFCCYTGLAYTDLFQLEPDDITKTIDGETWIVKNRQKTGTLQNILLLPIPLEILNKYKDNHYCLKNNKILPVNSNQRYNSYLQELADICGITKHLTSHIARHTCATTVLMGNGVSIEAIASIFGHTNIRTTQIYAKVYQKKVSEEMKELRAKLAIQTVPKIKKIG